MNLNTTIERYELLLVYYDTLPESNASTAAAVSQLIKWLKDYKRLLEAEKNWRKSLEAEIVKKDEEIKALKAELNKPITFGALPRQICLSGDPEVNQFVADWEKRRSRRR